MLFPTCLPRALRGCGAAALLAGTALPGRAQTYTNALAGATNTLVYQGQAFTNAAGGSFISNNSTITYAGPAAGTFVNDGRYVARNGATDVFSGPGGSAGAQELGGSVAPRFYSLVLSNGAGSNFTSTNEAGLRVAGVLTFANAYTITPRTAATNAGGAIHFLPGASYAGITSGADVRFVDGYVLKIGTGAFELPVGQAGDQRPVQLTGAGLPVAADSVAVAWLAGSAATTPDPSDGNATHALTSLGAGVADVSPTGYWDWVRPTTSGSVPVSVSIPAQSAAFAAPADLRLVGWNGSQWVALGTAGTTTLAEGQLLTGTVVPGITALAVGKTATPLPVELLTFTATRHEADGLLAWRTASERNSAYFEVQQSKDGAAWQALGQVTAAGSSLTPRDYTYLDARIARYGVTLVYYRLRQVDQDGTEAYSPVRTVAIPSSGQPELALFPNPTTRAATLTGAAPGSLVTVYDALGRQVLAATATADGTAALVLPVGLATGVYVVRASSQALRLTVE